MSMQTQAASRPGKSSSKAGARKKSTPESAHSRSETIGFLLWDSRRAISHDFERLISPHGVSRSTFWILRILWDEDGKTQAELAKRCRMKGPTIVGIVAQLEREKLVTRADDPNDSRKKIISLTPKGSALRSTIVPIVEDVNKRATKGFSAAERNQLKEMLRRIRRNMDNE